MLTIVDYGVGNLASIKNMLKKVGCDALISSNESEILSADKLILPGVGAFDTCANKLKESGLLSALNKKALEEKIPLLGICVGCQLLMEKSEEGIESGLGWIKGEVKKFDQQQMTGDLKIPHMGWTDVELNKPSLLFKNMYDEPRFYFVHSYYPAPINSDDVLMYANYGYKFAAAVERENIIGVQFHPEKSHKFGMKLLENFVNNY
ncbi:MAG TPA: imidazole glycerol phosphate synthase subunit HisH [Puia sp.]|jgi:glutamine amidotransferase|nr:imidazole glycerol phosphate synthase subunit HisH [Puia sp.]